MDTTFSLEELAGTPAAGEPKKPKGKVVPLASIAKPEPVQPTKPSLFPSPKLEDTQMYSGANIRSSIAGVAKSLVAGEKWMSEKIAEGLTGLVMARGTDLYDEKSAAAAAKRIRDGLSFIDTAPADKQEEAVQNALGLIGELPGVVGDIFDKYGGAVAGAGATALTTFLMLKPEVGVKALKSIKDAYPKSEPGEPGKPAPAKAAFDVLAATDSQAAEGLAEHVRQSDPALHKYMKRRIDKFTRASEDDLLELGRKAAEENLKALEPPTMEEIIAGNKKQGEGRITGTRYQKTQDAPMSKEQLAKEEAQNRAMLERAQAELAAKHERLKAFVTPPKYNVTGKTPSGKTILTPERVSANIRTTVQEAQGELEKLIKLNAGIPLDIEKLLEVGKAALGQDNVKKFPNDKNAVVYLNAGIPVTKGQVRAAFTWLGESALGAPGVAVARGKLARTYETYIKLFNPEAMSPEARNAGAAIAENFFKQSQREHWIWEQGKERRQYWNKMGDEASIRFMNEFERGRQMTTPEHEQMRRAYKAWSLAMYRQDMRTWAKSGREGYEPVDNYLPHMFEDPEGAITALNKMFGNKWADPRFIHERGFDTYEQARKAGLELEKQGKPNPFKPKYKNPEELMQARQRASDIARLRTELLQDMERNALARRAKEGEQRPPDGFSPNSYRSPTGVRYWVRDSLDPLMRNAFNSKSLWSDFSAGSKAFRGFMELKNTIIPIKLMWSLFHPLHVMHIDAAAAFTRETKMLYAGDKTTRARVQRFMTQLMTSAPFTPGGFFRSLVDNPRMGYPILQVFRGKRSFESLSDADKAGFMILSESGMVPVRPIEEMNSHAQKFRDAIDQHSAKALYHGTLAILSPLQHLVYGVWIPSLKVASLLKDAKVALELNPNLTAIQRRTMLRDISRKVEARYGEMNYNSMFWNKIIKDVGTATNLSLGWNVGLLDQYVGGAIDLSRAVTNRKGVGANIRSGRLDRPIFAAGYIGSALMIGGLMTWFFTGKQPEGLEDYTHPLSGEKDQYGKPIRLNTMFYTREFEGLYKHMQEKGVERGMEDFIINKGSGMMEMFHAAITGLGGISGKDQIWNPDDPAYKKIEQGLLYEFGELEPISTEALLHSAGKRPIKMGGLSALGFTPAGKYISETPVEGKIADAYQRFSTPSERSYVTVMKSKDFSELRRLYKSDEGSDAAKYEAKIDQAIKDYKLTPGDVHKLERQMRKDTDFDPSVYMFSHLPEDAQVSLLKSMTPADREKYTAKVSKTRKRKLEDEVAP